MKTFKRRSDVLAGVLAMMGLLGCTLRKISDNEYFLAVSLRGGDAGDSWRKFAFLHATGQCQLTLLSTFYKSSHIYESNSEKECGGKNLSYRFISDHTIEMATEPLVCDRKGESSPKIETKKYDLTALLRDPKLRVFEP